MKIYEVVSAFFDNGKTQCSINEIEVDEKPESSFEERKRCDVYKDYFDNKTDAEKWLEDTYNA